MVGFMAERKRSRLATAIHSARAAPGGEVRQALTEKPERETIKKGAEHAKYVDFNSRSGRL